MLGSKAARWWASGERRKFASRLTLAGMTRRMSCQARGLMTQETIHGRSRGSEDPLWSTLWRSLSIAAVSMVTAGVVVSQPASAEEPRSQTLPVVTRAEVQQHKTKETGIWVIYKDGVYDITKFIANHPGGRDKIMLAAGGDIEPFWNIYRQHLNSPLAADLLKSMKIATLHPHDATLMAQERKQSLASDDNPYKADPVLSPVMTFYQRQPINAEAPASLLGSSWITPTNMWFVRNHHPVPHVDPNSFRLDIVHASDLLGKHRPSGSASDEQESSPLFSLRLEDLKKRFPVHSIVTSIQCGGNRRDEMTKLEKTNGSSWNVSAISTAKWTGIKLRDLLASVGVTEDSIDLAPLPQDNSGQKEQRGERREERERLAGVRHVHFVSVDGLEASIPIKKALSRYGDVLLAFEMNDEPLSVAHGAPLRVIVPGHVGVRNVKWVTKIRLSGEEAYGTWQRGMAYKGFGPSTKSLEGIDVEAIPSLQEQPVQSAITLNPTAAAVAGEPFTVRGYAYSGGGRGIVRVDVSIDGGKSWQTADLLEGKEQPLDRAWAWTLWECSFPIPDEAVGKTLQVICKATDASYNVQPDSVQGIWNLRGINNNAWHRLNIPVVAAEEEDEDE